MPGRQIMSILQVARVQVGDLQAVDHADPIDQVDKGRREVFRDREVHRLVLMDLEAVQGAVQVGREVALSNNDEVVNKSDADVSKRSFSHKS